MSDDVVRRYNGARSMQAPAQLLADAIREVERLREENTLLRELLKPFEEAAGKLDDEPVGVGRLVLVTLKDCRAIRAAIREGGEG